MYQSRVFRYFIRVFQHMVHGELHAYALSVTVLDHYARITLDFTRGKSTQTKLFTTTFFFMRPIYSFINSITDFYFRFSENLGKVRFYRNQFEFQVFGIWSIIKLIMNLCRSMMETIIIKWRVISKYRCSIIMVWGWLTCRRPLMMVNIVYSKRNWHGIYLKLMNLMVKPIGLVCFFLCTTFSLKYEFCRNWIWRITDRRLQVQRTFNRGSRIRFLDQFNCLLRYSETLLRRESNGQITTNSNIHKSHSHSGNKPEVDRGRRPLVIATALCGVFFIAG